MPKRITKNEKTDFIVNMTKPQFMMMEFIYLVLASLGALVCCVPYYLKRGNENLSGTESNFVTGALSNASALEFLKYGIVILMTAGFIGYLMLLISGTKNYFKLKENKIMLLLAGYLLLCGVSTAMANNRSLAFFGNGGRFEGFIAVISYAGFFFASSQLTDKKLKEKLLLIVCGAVALHAGIGIFQSFEATGELFPSFFTENYTFNGMAIKSFVANGFATSPYALASLCVMAWALCMGGIMYAEKKAVKILFCVFGIVALAGGLLTKNVAVIAGLSVSFITLLVIEIVRIKSGHCLLIKGFLKNPLGKLILGGVAFAGIFVLLFATGNFTFEDSYIILQDSSTRLALSFPKFSAEGVKVYPHVWKEALRVIKDNFVFGVGFEGLANAEMNVVGSCDRAYNEFLNIALTTGVASLVFYVGFLAGCAVRGVKGVKKFFNKEDNYTKASCFAGCAGYIAVAMFSTSTIVSTPIFFLLLGLCFSKTERDN